MANIKNYGIAGVGSDIQFGKKGGRLVFSEGAFSFLNEDGVNVVVSGIDTPLVETDAANKGYVDSVAQGLDFKDSVKYATVDGEVVDLTGGTTTTMDGQALADGDRVLVRSQTDGIGNGIYTVVLAGPWVRADDADEDGEVSGGSYVFVELGAINAFSSFVQTISGELLVDDPQDWTLFSKAGEVTAGQGLSLDSGTLNLELADLPNAAGAELVNPNIVLDSDKKASFTALMSNNTGLFVQSFGPAGLGRTGAVEPLAGDYSAVMVTYDPTNSSIVATNVQVAIEALDDLVSGLGTQVGDNIDAIAALDTRVTANADAIAVLQTADGVLQGNIDAVDDKVDALMAVNIGYDDTVTLFPAANVQEAIVELNTKIDNGLGSVAAAEVSYVNTTSLLAADTVQEAIDEVDGVVDGLVTQVATNTTNIGLLQDADVTMQGEIDALEGRVTTAEGDITALETTVGGHTEDIAALETTVSGHTTDIADLEFTVSGHSLQLSGLETRLDGVDDDITALEEADVLLDDRISALETADTNVSEELATLAAFNVNDGVGTSFVYVPATLVADAPGTPAQLTISLNYNDLPVLGAAPAVDARIALSDAAGDAMSYITAQELKDFVTGDLSSNTIGEDNSSVTVTDDGAAAGAINFVVDGTAVASASSTAFGVSVGFTGVDGTFSGDVTAANFNGNVVGGTVSGSTGTFDTSVTSPEFAGHLTGNVTGDVSGSIAGGNVAGGTGNFTGTVSALGGFTGNLTGNVTGDLTGNVTGNVEGDVTGNVTGNADTATAWADSMTMFVVDTALAPLGNVSFDGSEGVTGVTLTLNLASVTGDFLTAETADPLYVNVEGGDTMNGKLTISAGGLAVTGGTTTDTLASGTVTASGLVTANAGLGVTGGTTTDTLTADSIVAVSVDADTVVAGEMTLAGNSVTTAGDVVFALAADKLVRVTDGGVYDTSLGLAGSENGLVTKSFMDAAIATAVTGGSVGGVYTQKTTITLIDGTYPIGEALPVGSTVMSVRVNVTVPDASATLAVGTFMTVDENDPSENGVYIAENMVSGEGPVTAVVAGAAGTGSAEVMIEYRVA